MKTEFNYIRGLKDSLPIEICNNISIQVIKVENKDLVKRAIIEKNNSVRFSEIWIIFDKDEVIQFDQILKEASNNDIKVAWSNPCIEIWFSAYFNEMKKTNGSVECCREFRKLFIKYTNKEYRKNDKNIYNILVLYGNEERAINLANSKYKQAYEDYKIPSKMIPATTLHLLVEEIKKCIRR